MHRAWSCIDCWNRTVVTPSIYVLSTESESIRHASNNVLCKAVCDEVIGTDRERTLQILDLERRFLENPSITPRDILETSTLVVVHLDFKVSYWWASSIGLVKYHFNSVNWGHISGRSRTIRWSWRFVWNNDDEDFFALTRKTCKVGNFNLDFDLFTYDVCWKIRDCEFI